MYYLDCKFINLMTSNLINIVTNCGNVTPPQPTGNVLTGRNLEYATDALATDTYTLTIDGYIQYIYYQAYGTVYPEVITPAELLKIYAIYDALQIPRPIL